MEKSFGKLNLDDMREKFHDAPEDPSTERSSERGIASSKIPTQSSRPPRVDVNDTGDFSRKAEQDLTAVSSMVPPRGSSKKNRNTEGNEASIKRKSLPPQAQVPTEHNLTDTVDTSVATRQAPAVTHEVREKHTKEIIHENITRDVHIHHYHNIIQPIREVVIKPAVHFTIDANGQKVRIPAPEGWQPPPGLEPTIDNQRDVVP